MLTNISFLICGIMTILLSIFMITRKHPVSSAMTLVVIMMFLAGMYGILDAHFSAVVQLIVYAGAIMVVFVFVIMLLNLPLKNLKYEKVTISDTVVVLFSVLIIIFLTTKISTSHISKLFLHSDSAAIPQYFEATENVKNVSALMFTNYLWPFELVSFLILVSIVGAVIIAKKESKN